MDFKEEIKHIATEGNEKKLFTGPWWTDLLTERNKLLVKLSTDYSNYYSESGDVGHNYKLLVAQLTEMLNRIAEHYPVADILALYHPEA